MIMHDCSKTREQLVDLVFDELRAEERRRALAEVEGCQDCLAQYRSMTETLRLFDQAAEAAMPDEGYWLGYESRLRERLRQAGPHWKRRLTEWIGGFRILTARPVELVAGLALMLLAISWWGWRQRQDVGTSPLAIATPPPQPKAESREKEIAAAQATGGTSTEHKRKFGVPPSGGRIGGKRESPDGETLNAYGPFWGGTPYGLPEGETPNTFSIFTSETISHFEKAQLMLRSFRNASAANPPKGRARIDLDYERELSRHLLYQNILLRRDAEMKGDLPAEEALSNLEPFLLDIANLPDRPSLDDLREINERLRRTELIASLQIASAPAYQNP